MASYLKYTKIPTTVANDSLDTKSENCVLFWGVRITRISRPFCWLWLFINRRKVCNQYKIKIVYSIKRSLTVMYIKEQTVRRPNVNICKLTFCPIHYSLFTQGVWRTTNKRKPNFKYFVQWNVKDEYHDTGTYCLKIQSYLGNRQKESNCNFEHFLRRRRQPFV